jgi:serine protease Do
MNAPRQTLRCIALALTLLAALAPPAAGAGVGFAELEQQIVEIAERVKPSVVHVEAIVRIGDRRKQVTGSGVIASADGKILTNHHVVERAEKVTVTIPGRKKRHAAEIVGTDKQTDIALLRIESSSPVPAATFARTSPVRVGQWVLAIGNPYGLDGTVSFGIVSAIGRNLELPDTLNDFIQTDAMIDRGSSGGPLVDLEGRVVGINSRGQGRGIGFTIPIDTALEVANKLEAGGIERGYLGVSLQPLNRDLADYFGQADLTGAVVSSVIEDSPAERAGLETGDIITSFNELSVESEKDEDLGNFQRRVAAVEPGREASLEVVRKGKLRRVSVRIGTQPHVEPDEAESNSGFQVLEITKNLMRGHRLGTDRGAFVFFVAPGSPAAEAGLMVGDVVERIEAHAIGDLDDFRQAMERVASEQRFLITARRGEETRFLLVKRGAREVSPPEPPGDAGQASHPKGED